MFYRKKREKESKAQIFRRHAKKRAFQRYGISLNHEALRSIKKSIETKDAGFLKRRSDRVTEWEVMVESKKVRFLYDSVYHEVVTCLPPRKSSLNKTPG